MADPITLTALTMTVAASAVSAVGAVYAGQAQAAAYQYKAQIDKMNAGIATSMAGQATQEEQVRQEELGFELRARRNMMRSEFGARGLYVDSGSAASAESSAREMGRIDQAMMEYDYDKKRFGYEVQALGATASAGLNLMGADASKTEGYIKATASILGGGSTFSNQWMQASASGSLGSGSDLTATVVGAA